MNRFPGFFILVILALVTADGYAADRALADSTSATDTAHTDTELARTTTDIDSSLAGDGSVLEGIDSEIMTAVIPHELEIKILPGDFISWGKAKTLQTRDQQTLRLGAAYGEQFFSWELADGPFPGGNILQTGTFTLPRGAVPGSWQVTDIDPWGLPSIPPATPRDFYLRMIDSAGRPSNTVVITYQADDAQTRFTEVGLNPHILDPLRLFVDLANFEIIDSDEGSDEPYLINILIVVDGTTVDVFDLPGSSVRVLANPTTHGNIPQYNGNLSTGSTVFIPDETGRLLAVVAPINPELADVNLFGNYITPDFLNRASTLVLLSIAMEEDLAPTSAVQAMSNALIGALQSRLNETIRNTTLAQLLPMLTQAGDGNDQFDPLTLVPRPYEETCATFESLGIDSSITVDCRPGWIQMQDDVIEYGKEIAKAQTLNTWNVFEIIGAAVNPDDYIGLNIRVFNLADLRAATQPVPIDMDFQKTVPTGPDPEGPQNTIHYRVTGKAGRCVDADPSAPCVPYYGGFYYNGVWIPGTGPGL